MDGVMVLDQAKGKDFQLYNADCIDVLRGLPDNSIGYSVYSPPFSALYVFSDSVRDVSNSVDEATFWSHYTFIAKEMYRVMKPGRNISIHVMDLPTSKFRDGVIGLRDFPSQNRQLFEDVGFIFHSRAIIRKDPVIAMQRSKALGLLHKQTVKDSALSRMGIPDFVMTLRKPGENTNPVSGLFDVYYGDDQTDDEFTKEVLKTWRGDDAWKHSRTSETHKSILIWQRYAEPVWNDINQGDVLSRTQARDVDDERHISPLQLTVIRRCLQMWTNKDDIVFSPFAGIGSAGFVALEMGRRFVGVELKESYYAQAVKNLRAAERAKTQGKVAGFLY